MQCHLNEICIGLPDLLHYFSIAGNHRLTGNQPFHVLFYGFPDQPHKGWGYLYIHMVVIDTLLDHRAIQADIRRILNLGNDIFNRRDCSRHD